MVEDYGVCWADALNASCKALKDSAPPDSAITDPHCGMLGTSPNFTLSWCVPGNESGFKGVSVIKHNLLVYENIAGTLRDDPQHITQSPQGGELPVGTVAAAAHGPGDECTSGYRWTEDDGD